MDRVARPALPGPTAADVCVVGAGYTGLWTAYYLARAAPELRVVVVEQRFAGYGASGRNGGWLANSITGGRDRYVRTHGASAAHALQVALNDTVDEVLRVVAAEGIDAGVARGGELTVATNDAQWARAAGGGRGRAAVGRHGRRLLDAGMLGPGSPSPACAARPGSRTRRGCSPRGWWPGSPAPPRPGASRSTRTRGSPRCAPGVSTPPAARSRLGSSCARRRGSPRVCPVSGAPGCR